MMVFVESSDCGARRWMYSAAVMVGLLGKMIKQGRANKGLIPKGIFLGVQKRFFQLIIKSNDSCDLSETLVTSLLAAKALAVSSCKTYSLRQFSEVMGRFSKFFDSLNENRTLSSDELKLAEEMMGFFHQVEIIGERSITIPL